MDKKDLIPGKNISSQAQSNYAQQIWQQRSRSRGLYLMYAGDSGRGCILSERKFAEIEG